MYCMFFVVGFCLRHNILYSQNYIPFTLYFDQVDNYVAFAKSFNGEIITFNSLVIQPPKQRSDHVK